MDREAAFQGDQRVLGAQMLKSVGRSQMVHAEEVYKSMASLLFKQRKG